MIQALLITLLFQPVASISENYDRACPPERRAETSARLAALSAADQADRTSGPIRWGVVEPRDRERRREVASIFAEGCLVTAKDHLYAAGIYNHGNVPAHNYQTYLWAQRAVALGEEEARIFIVRGIDRFLLNNGYKQLYGANASADAVRGEDGKPTGEFGPYCLDPVAEDFTDAERQAMGFATLEERLEWVKEVNADQPEPSAEICDKDLEDPPRGLFPGIW